MRRFVALFASGAVACSAPSYGFADASGDATVIDVDAGPQTLESWCTAERTSTPCSSGAAALTYFVDGACYVWFCGTNSDHKVGWHVARSTCIALDGGSGHLVYFETAKELADVTAAIGTAGGSKLWIGASATTSAGPFYWNNATPVTVNAWADGGPGPTGSCVSLDMSQSLWTNTPCGDDNSGQTIDATQFHNFICEVQ